MIKTKEEYESVKKHLEEVFRNITDLKIELYEQGFSTAEIENKVIGKLNYALRLKEELSDYEKINNI